MTSVDMIWFCHREILAFAKFCIFLIWFLIFIISIYTLYEDIDECYIGSPCKRNQRCYNTNGSYKCQSLLTCSGGYTSNDEGTQCIGMILGKYEIFYISDCTDACFRFKAVHYLLILFFVLFRHWRVCNKRKFLRSRSNLQK